MQFLTQLFHYLLTPIGLVGLFMGLILVLQAQHSAQRAWLLVSLCGFAASLGKLQNQFVLEPPALVFPLQQLREAGRPLAIVLMGLIIIVAWLRPVKFHGRLIPLPIIFLALVQFVIFLKTLFFGDILFAGLAGLTFSSLIVTILLGPRRWLEEEPGFELAVKSMVMVGIIFVIANSYQALFDIYPIIFHHGQLLGTTANPQFAAILLAVMIPSLLFLIEQQNTGIIIKFFWIGVLVIIMFALILTGSRTGWLMGAITFLLFYRSKLGELIRLAGLISIIFISFYYLSGQDLSFFDTSLASATNKFLYGTNTRQDIWLNLWQTFSAYPLFGAPLQGDRLAGYGENSWLGAAAALGIIGLVPLVLFGASTVAMILRLHRLSGQSRRLFLQTSMVIAGLTSLLIGSIFEPFLLGNITFSLMALFLYLSLGQHILDSAKINIPTPQYAHNTQLTSEKSPQYSRQPYRVSGKTRRQFQSRSRAKFN